jgi:tetratricopeptide (TPR) repeat protein
MMLPALLFVAALAPGMQDPPAETPAETPAVAADPGASSSEIQEGLAAFRRKRFAAAKRHFQSAVDANPNDAAATFYLAYTVYKIAEPKRPFHPEKQQAAELFDKAYALDPNFKPVWAPRK